MTPYAVNILEKSEIAENEINICLMQRLIGPTSLELWEVGSFCFLDFLTNFWSEFSLKISLATSGLEYIICGFSHFSDLVLKFKRNMTKIRIR